MLTTLQEMFARGSMNRFIMGVLRGIAMGRDGDQILYNVATTSHAYETETCILEGAVGAHAGRGGGNRRQADR